MTPMYTFILLIGLISSFSKCNHRPILPHFLFLSFSFFFLSSESRGRTMNYSIMPNDGSIGADGRAWDLQPSHHTPG